MSVTSRIRGTAAAARSRISRRRRRRRSPSSQTFAEGRTSAPLVDLLPDADLKRLNDLLPWHCFLVDGRGRPFGRPAWSGKRDKPEQIPDPRIELFDSRFGLADKHVLEIGCFEGVHTIALCDRAARVTAADSRVENVVKTMVRCAFLERHPTALVCDVERPGEAEPRLRADLCHHIGVLYHLADPVRHLRRLADWVGTGLMLDTHFVEPEDADESYSVDGRAFAFRRHGEARSDPFSGMQSHAKWLTLDDIVDVLSSAGFSQVEVVERRQERNGDRALLLAEKSAAR